MKRMRAVIFLLAFALILAVLTSFDGSDDQYGENIDASFIIENSEPVETKLEVADTSKEREIGLMNREELDSYHGMLFVYPEEGDHSFWMKNTLIPLDIIFLNGTKHVINVETAYPEPDTPEEELKRYRSDEPARYVIELNAGFAQNHSISRGTKVSWNEER